MVEPLDLAKTRAAYDIVAESYSTLIWEPFGPRPVDLSLVSAFIEMIASQAPATVADIGCGPGHTTNFLGERGLDAVGVDLSPGMIDVARRTYPHLRFDVGSMEHLDFSSASLAGIVAWYSIIHVPPDRHHLVFAEFARVLRPGGYLLLGFQTGDEPRHLAHAYGHDIDLDAYRLPISTTSSRLEKAGFEALAHLVLAPLPDQRTPQAVMLATRANAVG